MGSLKVQNHRVCMFGFGLLDMGVGGVGKHPDEGLRSLAFGLFHHTKCFRKSNLLSLIVSFNYVSYQRNSDTKNQEHLVINCG